MDKQRLAACIRAMGKEPCALLYIDDAEETCDEAEILGIPVYHAIELMCYEWDRTTEACPFIPIGETAEEITYQDRKRFADAWSDYKGDN